MSSASITVNLLHLDFFKFRTVCNSRTIRPSKRTKNQYHIICERKISKNLKIHPNVFLLTLAQGKMVAEIEGNSKYSLANTNYGWPLGSNTTEAMPDRSRFLSPWLKDWFVSQLFGDFFFFFVFPTRHLFLSVVATTFHGSLSFSFDTKHPGWDASGFLNALISSPF